MEREKMNETEEIEIEGIKETTRKELEELEIERINKIEELKETEKELKIITIAKLKREIIIQTISKHLNIELIKVSKKSILSTATAISDRKNITIEPINSTLKSKIRHFCHELPFGIISFNRNVTIETIDIISYDKK